MKFKSTNLPIEDEYPKLIRDRIPEILNNKGLRAKTKFAKTDKAYLSYLLKKVVEESVELMHSLKKNNTQEEIADVLELIESIIKLKGWSKQDIQKIQREKRKKNGGFDKRLIMKERPLEPKRH